MKKKQEKLEVRLFESTDKEGPRQRQWRRIKTIPSQEGARYFDLGRKDFEGARVQRQSLQNVSHRHCIFELLADGRWVMTDCSTNGLICTRSKINPYSFHLAAKIARHGDVFETIDRRFQIRIEKQKGSAE
jgi:FHA domain